MEGTKAVLKKQKRDKFIRKVPCHVCGDTANDHIHYGAKACYSCRAFFRRCQIKMAANTCNNQDDNCQINKFNRQLCPHCRYKKCLAVGMRPDWVMSEQDKNERKAKAATKAKSRLCLTQYEQKMRYVCYRA